MLQRQEGGGRGQGAGGWLGRRQGAGVLLLPGSGVGPVTPAPPQGPEEGTNEGGTPVCQGHIGPGTPLALPPRPPDLGPSPEDSSGPSRPAPQPVPPPLAVAGHEADDLFQFLSQLMLPTGGISVQSGENLGEGGVPPERGWRGGASALRPKPSSPAGALPSPAPGAPRGAPSSLGAPGHGAGGTTPPPATRWAASPAPQSPSCCRTGLPALGGQRAAPPESGPDG